MSVSGGHQMRDSSRSEGEERVIERATAEGDRPTTSLQYPQERTAAAAAFQKG